MKIVLANPHGFCAGVNRAVNIVDQALKIYGAPIYVFHEIVHNHYVVDELRKRGVVFIQKIEKVPDNSVLIFSAHGVTQSIRNKAKNRNLTIFDATCPLVVSIHMEVLRASRCGKELILIGHAGHPEVEGTIGQYDNPEGGIYLVESIKDVFKIKVKNETHLSFITQTTLSIDETSDIIDVLYQRFPKIIKPNNNICYATTNRQEAVRLLANTSDVVLVIGSDTSSNAQRLVELVQRMGKIAFLIEDESCIQEKWVKKSEYIGITAGASTPEILVKNVITRLQELGCSEVISLQGRQENTKFKIPKELIIKT